MRWTIRRKLLAFAAVSVFFLGVSVAVGVWADRDLDKASDVERTLGLTLRDHMDVDMMQDALRGDVLLAMQAETPADRSEAEAALQEHVEELHHALDSVASRELVPALTEQLHAFAPQARAFADHAAEMVQLAGRDRSAAHARLGAFRAEFRAIEDKSDAVTAALSQASVESAARQDVVAARLIGGLTIGGLLGLVLLIVLSQVVARSILTPLKAVTDRLAEVAHGDGDLTARVPYDGADELGELARSFNTFVGKIEETVSLIAENAVALAAAAEEMAVVSRQLTTSSETGRAQSGQAAVTAGTVNSSVTTIATAVEQLSAAIREIARSASEAATVASEAAALASQADRNVELLGQGSVEIGEVINSITAVAQKTNLLALNATIEAARAGDAGKGFAVVANEVKELANQAGASSEDIGRRIQTVQAQVKDVVEAIRRIARVVDQINQFQAGVASAVEEQSAVASEMGRGVQDAARGTSEIADVMRLAAQTADESSTASGEAARTAADLARMASALERLVGQFRTGGQGGGRSGAQGATRPATRVAVGV